MSEEWQQISTKAMKRDRGRLVDAFVSLRRFPLTPAILHALNWFYSEIELFSEEIKGRGKEDPEPSPD